MPRALSDRSAQRGVDVPHRAQGAPRKQLRALVRERLFPLARADVKTRLAINVDP